METVLLFIDHGGFLTLHSGEGKSKKLGKFLFVLFEVQQSAKLSDSIKIDSALIFFKFFLNKMEDETTNRMNQPDKSN